MKALSPKGNGNGSPKAPQSPKSPKALPKNTYYFSVLGSGLPEVDGLYVPSTAPPVKSESGTVSSLGYWNDKMAWDRADGKSARNPAFSYSNSYKAWRLCRLDGHLAYDCTTADDMPPAHISELGVGDLTLSGWNVYKKGVAPAPQTVRYASDPRVGLQPNGVFALGGPGAGKGTMCELAEQQLNWVHLSAGDLLRAERKREGSENGKLIEDYIAQGKIVPVEITVTLLKAAMEAEMASSGRSNFLVDGFPRSLENWAGWKRVFGEDCVIPVMLFFECPLAVLEARILKRGKYSGRSDDNIESLRKRFVTYKEETMPIVEVFREKGKAVELDTSLERVEVWELVKKELGRGAFTDAVLLKRPLTERSEMCLGLRPYPKKEKKEEVLEDKKAEAEVEVEEKPKSTLPPGPGSPSAKRMKVDAANGASSSPKSKSGSPKQKAV